MTDAPSVFTTYSTYCARQCELSGATKTQFAEKYRTRAQEAQELFQATAQKVQALQDRYREEARTLSMSDEGSDRLSSLGGRYQAEYAQLMREHGKAAAQSHREWLKEMLNLQLEAQKNAATAYFEYLERLTAESQTPPQESPTPPASGAEKKSARK